MRVIVFEFRYPSLAESMVHINHQVIICTVPDLFKLYRPSLCYVLGKWAEVQILFLTEAMETLAIAFILPTIVNLNKLNITNI